MNWRPAIPNGITFANLLCGVSGVVAGVLDRPDWTLILVLTAAFLDFFDGFFARLLNVAGPLGKELDSLADLVTFGVAPAIALISAGSQHFILGHSLYGHWTLWTPEAVLVKFSGAFIACCAAYRLAKFNTDPSQSEVFKGLASPAAAIGISSFAAISSARSLFFQADVAEWIGSFQVLSALGLLIGALMVINQPMFSLKFKDYGWSGNQLRYGFLMLCVGYIIGGWFVNALVLAFPLIILTYVGLSFLTGKPQKN